MAGEFEMIISSDEQFFFSLIASNGETILKSERYKAKSGAENGIKSVQTNATNDARYVRKTSSNGKAYFVLKAANGEIIGTSQMYSSEDARNNGIEPVKQNAPDAKIDVQM